MSTRYVEVTVNGTAWRMPVNYRAAMQIARTVGDPLQMVQRAARGQLEWSMADVVSIIEAGLAAAGCSLTKEQVGEEVVNGGINAFLEPASKYIASLVNGGPARPVEVEAKKE